MAWKSTPQITPREVIGWCLRLEYCTAICGNRLRVGVRSKTLPWRGLSVGPSKVVPWPQLITAELLAAWALYPCSRPWAVWISSFLAWCLPDGLATVGAWSCCSWAIALGMVRHMHCKSVRPLHVSKSPKSGKEGFRVKNLKISPKTEVFGRTSLRTPGQKLRSGPPNPGKTSSLARTCRADVHEKTSVWKTSGWFFVPYFGVKKLPFPITQERSGNAEGSRNPWVIKFHGRLGCWFISL